MFEQPCHLEIEIEMGKKLIISERLGDWNVSRKGKELSYELSEPVVIIILPSLELLSPAELSKD